MDIDWNSLDEPQKMSHEFEIDLNCVVVVNHALTLEGIDRSEDEELAKIDEGFGHEGFETVRSITLHLQNFYDDLRQAARRLAFVALVTRLQHWIGRFARQTNIKPSKAYDSLLTNQIAALNERFGAGPISETFFEELATVRDCVVHADSRAEWTYKGRLRKVHIATGMGSEMWN